MVMHIMRATLATYYTVGRARPFVSREKKARDHRDFHCSRVNERTHRYDQTTRKHMRLLGTIRAHLHEKYN